MKFRSMYGVLLAALLVTAQPLIARAAESASSLIGEDLQVFPGDKFYAEGDRVEVPILELASPIEGRMPGSMRIPFNFAIDTRTLHWVRDRDGWRYFAAPQGTARAWHGIVGDVLASGDTVGVRVRKKDGLREWFVDNSIHNRGMDTIWHRKVENAEGVKIASEKTEKIVPAGARLRGLEYLGIRDNQIRIRYSEFGKSPREDEFFFPIEQKMPMLVGVMGLRAEIGVISGVSARIKIIRGFEEGGFANPAP